MKKILIILSLFASLTYGQVPNQRRAGVSHGWEQILKETAQSNIAVPTNTPLLSPVEQSTLLTAGFTPQQITTLSVVSLRAAAVIESAREAMTRDLVALQQQIAPLNQQRINAVASSDYATAAAVDAQLKPLMLKAFTLQDGFLEMVMTTVPRPILKKLLAGGIALAIQQPKGATGSTGGTQ